MNGQIYVGTYHKYNNGNLKGKWFDLDDYVDKSDFIDAAREYHSDETDPELMFQDWEDIPDLFISESYIAPSYWDVSEQIDDNDLYAFERFLDVHGYDLNQIDEAIENFEQYYMGEWTSEREFAEDWIETMGGEINVTNIDAYFDAAKMARSLDAAGWHEATHTDANNYPDDYPDGAGVYDEFGEYMGNYNSIEDYVDQQFEDGIITKEDIVDYFDYDKFSRDLFIDQFYFDDRTGYVFGRH